MIEYEDPPKCFMAIY